MRGRSLCPLNNQGSRMVMDVSEAAQDEDQSVSVTLMERGSID